MIPAAPDAELETVEGAVYAECSGCNDRIRVYPDSPPLRLDHNDDGSHTVTPIGLFPTQTP